MFREVDFAHLAKFNSDASNKLISIYETATQQRIQSECARPSSCTFAPSSIRCKRKSWFRLRGTQPDFLSNPDLVLDFTAKIGTAIHELVQETLSTALGADWVSVEDYLEENPIPYEYSLSKKGYETSVSIKNPPMKFACDGILKLSGNHYLLEIKSSEYSSWDSLVETKQHHKDQIRTYSTILNISKVLTLYVDRQYGGLKCYESTISLPEMQQVKSDMEYVQDCVKKNIAPERLPATDYMCRNCEYRLKCQEW